MIGRLEKFSRYLLAGASLIGTLAFSIPDANAQDLKAIQSQIDSMQATIKALQKQVADAKAQAAAANSTAAGSAKSDLDLKVKWKGAPEFSSADEKKFKFKVRGRIDADYNAINQDTNKTFAPDVNGTALRRARLGVEGVVFYDLKYILEVDFANDAVVVKDAYIQYTGLPVYFTAGNLKTYNGLEEMGSANYLTFMERSAFVEAFGLDRQIGFGATYYKDHFTLAAGIFGESNTSAPLFSGFIGDENLTFAARGTVAPINREVNGVNQVLHFGASVRTRETGDDQPFLQYQARGADLFLANRFVNTGRIGESDTFWGLEAAGVWGPLSVQGEYTQLEVDLPTGAFIRSNPPGAGLLTTVANPFIGVPDPTYNGWYVDASYFLTGETRPYKDGVFQRVKVKNPLRWAEHSGWGAWQIAGRYDVIDLSDTAFNNAGGCPTIRVFPGLASTGTAPNQTLTAPSIPECGEQKTWIVGLNWYLNDYVRLFFNYTESELIDYPITNLTATATQPISGKVAGFDGAKIRGFGMRAHVDW